MIKMKKGIDVSAWQGSIDWRAVAASGIDFAIIKCGAGNKIADNFETNYAGAKAAGLPVGAYVYSYAHTTEEAVREAETCKRTLAGKQLEYPVFFDIEEASVFKLGMSRCSAIVQAFCETMEDAGYYVGIYSSKSHLESYISKETRNRYCVWVAHYYVNKTSYSGNYDIHQFTDRATVNGIRGNVDMNYCYADYSIIKEKGYNGFRADGDIPEKAPVRATFKTIKKGSNGDFVELAQVLLKIKKHDIGKSGADGKFGNDTENAVKEFQKSQSLVIDGIIGPETWAKLLII